MAQVQDIILGGLNLTVLPGGYGKRNKRTGGRPASFERLRIDTFTGQRQAFGAADRRLVAADYAWDGLGVGPAFDGQGVEPFPNVTSFADGNLADTPSATVRAYGVVAGNNAFVGLGRRIYKSVALSNGTWSALTAAGDLGAGLTISGLAYYQDDLLVMLGTSQDIRKFNTATNTLTVWRAGERGVVGVGYAGQLIYAPRAANAQEELRLSGTKWNGNAVTHVRYLDSPIVNMALYNGVVAIATRTSLYRLGGQPYPGEADDPTVSADTSKAPEWRGDPEPLMTHGQIAGGDDFTFLASFRGRLYTWLQGRVAEYDGDRMWTRMGPEGVRCYGGCIAGDWLCVAIQSRYGDAELWGFDGAGWWRLLERSTPAAVWPNPLAGAGNRELIVFRDGSATYDLARLNWRSSSIHTYATAGEWRSPLLDAGNPGASKQWREVGATFAAPASRGNSGSADSITLALESSTDGGATWVTAATLTTTAAATRAFTLRSALAAPVQTRYLQLRVVWSSVSDWAPVLASVWAEYEVPELAPPRKRIWELVVDAGDHSIRRDGQVDPQRGRSKIDGLWTRFHAGHDLAYTDIDGALWTPAQLDGVALWLDAAELSGLSNGDPVANWADATANGLAAMQGAVINQPTYRPNVLNGLPVVRFDGGDWLTVANALGITGQPYAQFAVWKAGGALQALMIWANNTGLLITDFDNDVGIFSGSALFDFDHHAFGQWHLVAGVHNDASSSLTVDGQTSTVGSAGAGAPSGELTIGAGIAGADRWLNGDLAELVITKSALTADERQRIEGYLAHKWGLAASLPSTHPYKLAAPAGAVVRIASIEENPLRPGDAGRWGQSAIALMLEES